MNGHEEMKINMTCILGALRCFISVKSRFLEGKSISWKHYDYFRDILVLLFSPIIVRLVGKTKNIKYLRLSTADNAQFFNRCCL